MCGSSVGDGAAGGERGVEGGVVGGGGGVFVARKPRGVGSRGAYRRVGSYRKSVARWQLERARRREVIRLRLEGKTLVEIAGVLGVSLRTVKRDFARVRPYVKSQVRLRREREEQRRLESVFGGMSPLERLEALGRLMNFSRRRKRVGKPGEPARGIIVVDVDSALQGKVGLECVPPSLSFSGESQELNLEIRLLIHGRLVKMGNLIIKSKIVREDARMTISKAAYDRLMDFGRV